MEKVLNQEEIDAMVRAVRNGGGPGNSPVPPQVESWDLRRAGQIGREQLQAITLLHEGFARNLTHSLSAYLRAGFSVTLVSAEHLDYREFLQRVPETTYLASVRLDPIGVKAALQMDLKIAFPIIDLLLGGEGKSMAEAREITEIEEQILDSVARIVCREWGAAWQALALDVGFEHRLEAGAAQRLMSPEEKSLSLSFEVAMAEVRGGLNLAVPVSVSNALLRKIAASWTDRRLRSLPDSRRRLRQLLLDCPFQIELEATDLHLPVGALANLVPGQLLAFDRSAARPASLVIAGRAAFRALPARHGESRAARLLERPSQPAGHESGEENSK